VISYRAVQKIEYDFHAHLISKDAPVLVVYLQHVRSDQGCQVFTTNPAQLLLKTSPKLAQSRFQEVPR